MSSEKPVHICDLCTIWAVPSGPFETNAYLIALPGTQDAYLIDPAPGSFNSINLLIHQNQLHFKGVILTHSHWDHIADVSACLQHFPDIFIAIHPSDRPNLEKPGSDGLPCWINIAPSKPTKSLNEGDILPLGESSWEIIHTPGHSPGSICLYNEKAGLLFSGDTLFQGTYGNTSFPTSDPKKMGSSLKRLSSLPATTVVLPGHGGPTTIGQELQWLKKI